MALLPRLFDAARVQLTSAAERFIRSADQVRRANNRDPDPAWMIQARLEAELNKRPPSEEFQDLPVSVWADWTIKTIRGAVQTHGLGTFGQAAILTESMIADDRIQAAVNGRTKGVTKCEWNLEP